MKNSFGARGRLRVGNADFEIYRIAALDEAGTNTHRLPFSLRVLLENLLRNEDDRSVDRDDIEFLAKWDPKAAPSQEIAFTPARVLLQDFTGVPAVVDLASMRDAMKRMGGDPTLINPLQPVELVIDHSVQVDEFGNPRAFDINTDLEYERNRERYAFLRWGQNAFRNFQVVPPGMGIVHQINLEYLARVVFTTDGTEERLPIAYPDTLVGTDSHTTMVNGLGVLGWGVGGIEAEAAMLGQPVAMLLPQVVGFKLHGHLREGSTATDLVLTVTEMLRKKGVVGKFVEFFGPGLAALPLADRATIGNMAPEYGATCGIFPIDNETIKYLRMTGRSDDHIAVVEAYCKEQGLWREDTAPDAEYSDVLELDLNTVEPSVSGPRRPQDRVSLSAARKSFEDALPTLIKPGAKTPVAVENHQRMVAEGGIGSSASTAAAVAEAPRVSGNGHLQHGAVVIAAITSCTNTSNPSVMIGAGLLARKAVELGLETAPWVKTSLAPGSRVVTEYLKASGLLPYLEKLRFNLVGYGCTTCIGNSGPLPEAISEEVNGKDLVVASVLSGNRNFEGRINSDVRANYLMSPPLVVAYALAGSIYKDLTSDPLGTGNNGKPVYLRDIWPSQTEIDEAVQQAIASDMFRKNYATIFDGDKRWQTLPTPQGSTFTWEDASTYIRQAPYFEDMPARPAPIEDITGARVLAKLGHSITTDHISPAGSIKADSPAGKYLQQRGIQWRDFNSYGSRRGNHEVMVRGTFANTRLRNKIAPNTEGGITRHLPAGEQMFIYEASVRYAEENVPLIILAGKEYGSGSSRDWAAKGPRLLGVKAVIAESYERIHRSNLVGMGVLPLQFLPGQDADTLNLTGEEVYEIAGLKEFFEAKFVGGHNLTVTAAAADGSRNVFVTILRIDTPQEALYYRHGGILQYVLRQLLAGKSKPEAAGVTTKS
jgi:aconitate hydratase